MVPAEGRIGEEQAAERIAELCVAMVERPARGGAGDATDPQAWLAILRDDIAHLEQAISIKANNKTRGQRA